MQALRNSKLTARLVLGWFALYLVAALVSPLVKPANLQMVCLGSGGMKMVAIGGDGPEPGSGTSIGMDCPLCVGLAAPPPAFAVPLHKPSPLAHALQPIEAARLAYLSAPPLPSRGPPAANG